MAARKILLIRRDLGLAIYLERRFGRNLRKNRGPGAWDSLFIRPLLLTFRAMVPYVAALSRAPRQLYAPNTWRSWMSRRKIATTVYITREQDQALKLLAERTDTSVAQYIREGIDLVLQRHRAEMPQQLSLMGDEN